MRQIIILSILTFFIVSSCNNNDDGLNNSCNVANPVEDLAWLKEWVEDIKQSSSVDESYVSQTTYKGQTVFIIRNCCALCNSSTILAYCNGEPVFDLNKEDGKDNYSKFLASNQGDLIWTSPNFTCF